MQGIYKHIILEDIQLIVIQFQQEITYEGLKNFVKKILQNKGLSPRYKMLIDLRDSQIKIAISDIEKFSNLMHNNVTIFESSLVSILTKTPNQVTKAIIYSYSSNNRNMNCKVFSTLEVALHNLSISFLNFESIKNEIMKMRKGSHP